MPKRTVHQRSAFYKILNALRSITMGKFKIPSIPSTTNKTIRFPNDIIEKIEKAIQGKECTFSAFVIAALRAALDDLKK